jgi:hypothetical protein
MFRALLIVFSLTMLAGGAPGAEVRSNLGTLTCSTLSPGSTAENSSAELRVLQCTFKATDSGGEERYAGTIAELGAGKSPGGKLVLVWTVMGPAAAKLGPGALAQRYVSGTPGGASGASASRFLVGQRSADILLQQETTGPHSSEAAVTVLDLKLSLTPA